MDVKRQSQPDSAWGRPRSLNRGLVAGILVLALGQSAFAATNECRQLLMRQCRIDGSCGDVSVTVCDPDVAVIRERNDAGEPVLNFALRAGPVTPRSAPFGGGAHFTVKTTTATEVCSLPTQGGSLMVPALPSQFLSGIGYGPNKAKIAYVTSVPGIDTSAQEAKLIFVISALNQEFLDAGIALRFQYAGAAAPDRPVVEWLWFNAVWGLKAPQIVRASPGSSRFPSLDPWARAFIARGEVTEELLARGLLESVGLRSNASAEGGDTTPGRMSISAPGSKLSQCELGLLRHLFGSTGLALKP